MNREPLVMVCCSDIAGQVRGKAFPVRDLPKRLHKGVGWTPTNIQITAFSDIADTPFTSFGDLQLVPDPATEVRVDFADESAPEHFFLGNILHTDGTPWECCLRTFLKNALAELERQTGLRLLCAFEHEFYYSGGEGIEGGSYHLRAFRQQGIFAESLICAIRSAGLEPDTFMPEYGPSQYEVTLAPQFGVKAADHAVIVRELVRATAFRLGESVSFSPLVTPEIVGNGVHIHMSLHDRQGKPVSYDAQAPYGLSRLAGQFIGGILRHAPAVLAFTAPSVISYRRLIPHRWSAAYNNLGYRDREACVRICPVFEAGGVDDKAGQFNFEFRAADAAASPYLQLAILVHAGLQGIRETLSTPVVTESDPETMSSDELAAVDIRRLPTSLDDALTALTGDETASGWLPDTLLDVYQRHKYGEIELLRHLPFDEQCERYRRVY
jgi:glutamine synthetase